VRDEGYGASRLVVQHHRSTHQVFTLLMIFTDIFNTTHPNSAIDSLDSHTALRQYPLLIESKSSDQVTFLIFILIFHDESLCFRFITHFF